MASGRPSLADPLPSSSRQGDQKPGRSFGGTAENNLAMWWVPCTARPFYDRSSAWRSFNCCAGLRGWLRRGSAWSRVGVRVRTLAVGGHGYPPSRRVLKGHIVDAFQFEDSLSAKCFYESSSHRSRMRPESYCDSPQAFSVIWAVLFTEHRLLVDAIQSPHIRRRIAAFSQRHSRPSTIAATIARSRCVCNAAGQRVDLSRGQDDRQGPGDIFAGTGQVRHHAPKIHLAAPIMHIM